MDKKHSSATVLTGADPSESAASAAALVATNPKVKTVCAWMKKKLTCTADAAGDTTCQATTSGFDTTACCMKFKTTTSFAPVVASHFLAQLTAAGFPTLKDTEILFCMDGVSNA